MKAHAKKSRPHTAGSGIIIMLADQQRPLPLSTTTPQIQLVSQADEIDLKGRAIRFLDSINSTPHNVPNYPPNPFAIVTFTSPVRYAIDTTTSLLPIELVVSQLQIPAAVSAYRGRIPSFLRSTDR